jgi:hypothetical protein
VFETKVEQIPEGWAFLSSRTKYVYRGLDNLFFANLIFLRFEQASDKLRDLSLIRLNKNTGYLDVHRLIQEACFLRMDEEQKVEAFKVTLQLLRAAFPGRTGHTHLFTRWQMCEQIRHHVLAFQTQHEQLKKQGYSCQEETFVRLICDGAW